jgi:hypothetical protein
MPLSSEWVLRGEKYRKAGEPVLVRVRGLVRGGHRRSRRRVGPKRFLKLRPGGAGRVGSGIVLMCYGFVVPLDEASLWIGLER